MLTDLIIPQNLNSTKYEPFLQFTEAPAQLTDVQATAIDLYRRGLNVLPLKPHSKKPYKLKPFFTSRLHHCDDRCRHKGKHNIAEIFRRKNIALMTGRTSGNLLDIDCDSQEAFAKIGQELAARNLPFWAVSTFSGGRYLLCIVEGEAHNKPKDSKASEYCQTQEITRATKFRDVEFWGNRHLVVIPPSIHPSGIVYQWITPEPWLYLPPGETIPAVSIRQLEWLGVALERESSKKWEEPDLYGLPEWAAGLSHRNRLTFVEPLSEGERNSRLFNLACEMKAIGVDYHEAEQLIMDIAHRAGIPSNEASDTFKSAYKKERTTAREYLKGDQGHLKEWQRAKAYARTMDWRAKFGRKGTSRRKAYMACIERARMDGRLHWRATVREVAEIASMNKETAMECMRDMVKAGIIKRTAHEDAGIYRFILPSEFRTVDTTGSYSVRILDIPKTQAEQDVFGKLGLAAWYIWRHLLKQSARNGAQIAKELNLPRSSVYHALKVLTDPAIGLVTRSVAEGGVYYGEPKTDGSLAHMAAILHNGSSPAQARKEKHRLEREMHVSQVVRWAIWAESQQEG